MLFDSFTEARSYLLWASFTIALVIGFVANKTNFCTLGAVSDMVNIGSYARLRAWLLAMSVAILSLAVLEYFGLVQPDLAFPPYRAENIIFGENIFGGFLFGVGMTFASGCGSKTLIRIGTGNLKSIIVLIIIGIVAYYMTNPFPNSDQTLYSILFLDWLRPISVTVENSSDIGSFFSSENTNISRLITGLVVGFSMLAMIFKSVEFRTDSQNIMGGLVIGLAIVGGWWVSSNTNLDVEGEQYTMSTYYEEWDMLTESDAGKPALGRTLSPQSYTFINPLGESYGYVKSGFDSSLLTFGLVSVLGVIFGSMFWGLISKGLSIEWFRDFKDFRNHVFGATLMGLGGVLALGCTIGQGISGVSTLAVGSILTLVSIIFGSTLAMKAEYYGIVYEDASIYATIISSLCDLKIAPEFMRKLEAD